MATTNASLSSVISGIVSALYGLYDAADATKSRFSNYAPLSSLTDGSVTKVGTSTVGGADAPIYLSNGVPTAANPYPSAFSTVAAGGVNVAADSKADTLTV